MMFQTRFALSSSSCSEHFPKILSYFWEKALKQTKFVSVEENFNSKSVCSVDIECKSLGLSGIPVPLFVACCELWVAEAKIAQ